GGRGGAGGAEGGRGGGGARRDCLRRRLERPPALFRRGAARRARGGGGEARGGAVAWPRSVPCPVCFWSAGSHLSSLPGPRMLLSRRRSTRGSTSTATS